MSGVAQTLHGLANSFDVKDWSALGGCLADKIVCDYRDLRGVVETCTREEYVQLRKEALTPLKTQHLFSNLCITEDADSAICQLSALIMRCDEDGQRFDTHAIYDYVLEKHNDRWLITQIKQSVLWNDGEASIHAAAKAK
ncbi:MAG: nuclear transport factor 2 family protein [Coxiellaceae bacterium]|nr:nuclear transport factor 2 family protein [Coxiellaceae bacterium]